jgi:hypothetical protein
MTKPSRWYRVFRILSVGFSLTGGILDSALIDEMPERDRWLALAAMLMFWMVVGGAAYFLVALSTG